MGIWVENIESETLFKDFVWVGVVNIDLFKGDKPPWFRVKYIGILTMLVETFNALQGGVADAISRGNPCSWRLSFNNNPRSKEWGFVTEAKAESIEKPNIR